MKKRAYMIAERLFVPCLASLFLLACGTPGSTSAAKVTNGKQIAEDMSPSVVMLLMLQPQGPETCTGTFVNDSQLITAGHCVEDMNPMQPEIYVAFKAWENGQEKFFVRAKALSFQRHPYYSLALGVSPYDVSVVTFPANSAPAMSLRVAQSPIPGEMLTIVGYGDNAMGVDLNGQLIGSGRGFKRIGSNVIGSVSAGFITFTGLAQANGAIAAGSLASIGFGDSGGPLYVNGSLAGVASGTGMAYYNLGNANITAYYVDLNSPYVSPFIGSAITH